MPKYRDLAEAKAAFEFMEPSENVVCTRVGTVSVTNVPRLITRHSPDGFEWGYGGSGPSDFALNILLAYTGIATADKLYQDFKWQFIANMPKAGGTITKEQILSWLESKGVQLTA